MTPRRKRPWVHRRLGRAIQPLDRGRAEAWRSAYEHGRVGVGLVGTDGRWLDANPALCQLLGYSRDEFIARTTVDVLHPDEWAMHLVRREKFRAGDMTPLDVCLRLMHADGGTVHARVHVAPVDNGQGRMSHLVVQVQDIRGQVRAEESLRRHAREFRGLLDLLPDAVSVYRDERICYVNPQMVVLLGYARSEEVVGRSVRDFTHPEEREGMADRVTAMVLTGQPTAMALRRVVRRDGAMVMVECIEVPAMFDGEAAIVWIGRDVTERQEFQSRLLMADRLASVGTLAAGAAHEINNPLAFMIANLDFAVHELPRLAGVPEKDGQTTGPWTELMQSLREVREGAERVRLVVRDLKSFSRVDEEQRGPVDVRKVLDTTLNIAANEIRHRAQVVKAYGPVPLVDANEARLGQVFLNLVLNAAQAIPEGRQAEHTVRLVTGTLAGRAVVEVHDTGEGIPEGAMPRIFDPFFTTKPVGVGTGLGLSVCHGIVTALGGEITAESTPGQGTVFRVVLPAARPFRRTSRSIPAVTSVHRRGRVLVIDDEPVLGLSIKRMLSSEHEVTATTSARDALAKIVGGQRWDVILCDLMMPEMTGMDLYAALSASAPELVSRMVFLTGGAFTQRARDFLDCLPNARIDKPFVAAALRSLIQDILGTQPLPP